MAERQRLAITRISKGFQTRVPVEVRKFLKVEVGDRILWTKEGDRIFVEKA